MFIFTLKATGETIILPTPSDSNEQTKIDMLPPYNSSSEDDIEYMKFHSKRLKKHNKI
jgi:hypothetical protein